MDRGAIRLHTANGRIDLIDFINQIKKGAWGTAVTLYTGPFLDGFHLPHNDPFQQWLRGQRDKYQRQALSAQQQITEMALEQGDWQTAVVHARQQIEIDVLHEEGWRQLSVGFSRGRSSSRGSN